MIRKLDYTELKNTIKISPEVLNDDAEYEIIGQSRAAKSLDFGLRMKAMGYNIYASGLPGTGKATFAQRFAEEVAALEETPPDLCYIYNFKNPKSPKLLMLPAGMGNAFREDMDDLINVLNNEIAKVFTDKEYEMDKNDIIKAYQEKRDQIVKIMAEDAKEQNFGVKMTSSGVYFMPVVDGEMISEEQFEQLSAEQKDEITQNSEAVQNRAVEAMRIMRDFEKDTRKEIEDLEYSMGLFIVGRHIGRIQQRYEEFPDVLDYLSQAKEDILENLDEFLDEDTEEDENALQTLLPWYSRKNQEETLSKYKVNVIIDNSQTKGAPVVVDFNPTYSNLVGEIEYDNEFGNFTTDFMKIKAGILHKANGGYLILQAHDLLSYGHSWEVLRRVLKTGELTIEPLREYMSIAVTCIKPETAPINVKIILIGTSYYYDILYEFDDEFQKLFKIRAQFDYEMKNDRNNIINMVKFIKAYTDKEKTAAFDESAICGVIEYSQRLSEHQDKLTTRFGAITEVLAEAAAWAKLDNVEKVTGEYVKKAIVEKEYRVNIYEEKLSEMIEDEIILIDTCGKKVGQINGLAVLETGEYIFAKPTRITATTYVGKAGIINIEKEAKMSGSIHDKGIQVLTGYLGQTYAQEFPLALSCRVCFEQNYNGVDGDSASSTELYAILSSLTELPINQEIAVTGSMNQRGEIQPIGGVTYKIEGFFDLCNKRRLTGNQGVIIPVQNIKDLVLKDEVIEAVKDGTFTIYAITNIDDGIEILTGVKAGVKNEKGKYPTESVHGMALNKLKDFAKKSNAEYK